MVLNRPVVDLHGRLALITGAAKGIGAATARLFADAGARLVLTDIDPAGANLAGELVDAGAQAVFAQHDVGSEEEWARVFDLPALQQPLDILVSNAGKYLHRPLEETSLQDIQDVIAVNLVGLVLGSRFAVSSMKRKAAGAPSSSISTSRQFRG